MTRPIFLNRRTAPMFAFPMQCKARSPATKLTRLQHLIPDSKADLGYFKEDLVAFDYQI